MLGRLLIISTAFASAVNFPAFAADMPNDIVGTYNCKGNDPTLATPAYTSQYTISKNGEQYILADKVTDDKKTLVFKQFGLRRENLLIIGFQRSDDQKIFGTEYMIISDQGKRLEGTFSYWGQPSKIGTETCTRAD